MSDTFFTLLGIIITLVIQLLAGVWWAATINSEVRHLNTNIKTLTTNGEVHHEIQTKAVTTLGNKHDDLDHRLTIIETRCKTHHGNGTVLE